MRYTHHIIFLSSIILIGCHQPDIEKIEENSSDDRNKLPTIRTDQNIKNAEIVRSVTLSAEKMKEGDAIIASSIEAFKDFDHQRFSRKMSGNALEFALKDSRSLSEILKDETTLWNSDPSLKRSVIGTFSLLTGIIGVPDEVTVSRLPELFLNHDFETERDMLMLQSARQAVRLAVTKQRVRDEDFSNWLLMAQSANELTRYTALILFDLVDPSNDQLVMFFKSYSNEQNKIIKEFSELKRKQYVIN